MKVKDKYLNFYYETIGEVPEPVIDPRKTALLIVDMQNQFVRRDSPEAEGFKAAGEWERWIPFHDRLDEIVIPNNVKLLECFRKHGMTVTYAQIACLREDGEEPAAPGKRLYLRLPSRQDPLAEKVKLVLSFFPGEAGVVLYYADTKKQAKGCCQIHPALLEDLQERLGKENVVLK